MPLSSASNHRLSATHSTIVSDARSSASEPDYRAWNTAIAHYFFDVSLGGMPVYLQADSEGLVAIGRTLGLPAEKAIDHFVEKVRGFLRYEERDFQNVDAHTRTPLCRDEAPLFIGFLALCVLAASRMERDEVVGISATNYYHHLNALLRTKYDGIPHGFKKSLHAWHRLNEWLNNTCQGIVGVATAQPLAADRPYVGFPQSQCLLRAADRQHLPQFFQWARLQPDDRPDSDFLLRLFQTWAQQSSGALSHRLQKHLQEDSCEDLRSIATIIAFELQNWDGSVPIALGSTGVQESQRSLLQLRINPFTQVAVWQEYRSTGSRDTLSYDPTLMPEGPAWLTDDLQSLADPVVVFGQHPELGEWIQRPRIALGMSSVLLVHVTVESEVRHYLGQKAHTGWALQALRGLPSTWRCIRNVRIEQADIAAPWTTLRTYPEVALRLVGGLKLDRQTYLAGYEPTLEIAAAQPVCEVRIDDSSLPAPVEPVTHINITDYHLPPGWHQIHVDGRTIAFFTRTPQRNLRTPGAIPPLGYHLKPHGSTWIIADSLPRPLAEEQECARSVILSGAVLYGDTSLLPRSLPYTVMVPSGFKRYIFLGAQLGAITIIEGARSIIAGNTDHHSLQTFTLPFEPQWLIKVGSRRYLSTFQLSPAIPDSCEIYDSTLVKDWAQWISRKHELRLSTEVTTIWRLYQDIARVVSRK